MKCNYHICKEKYLPFFLLIMMHFFYNSNSSAQNHTIDSLTSFVKISKEDTTKVNTLNTLCREVKNTGDFQKANQYANDALSLSKKLRFKKGEAKAYNNIGIIFDNQGDYENALKNYIIALKIREEIGDKTGIAGSYNNIGNIYYAQGNYSAALKNHLSSLKTRTEINDKNGMAICFMNIGNVYHLQGNYSDALKNQFSSLKLREELGDKQGIANCYNNIGNIYYSQNIYKEALKNQMAALKIRKEIGDKNGIGSSYNNIGIIYYLQGNFSDALINQLASLKIMEEIGDKRGIAMSYNNIGIIYKNKGNYDEALKNQLASLKLAQELEDKNGIANCYTNIGIVFTKQGKFKEASEYLDKGLKMSKEIGAKDYIKDTYSGLAELDSAQASSFPIGNGPGKFWRSAFENHKMAIIYRDSLVNQETSKKLVESQMQYEFDKKESVAKAEQEKKDALNIAERRKQTIILYFVGFVAFLILCFAVFAYRSYRQKQKANSLLEEKNNYIEKQKILVEEKNREITDSINYAKRIQHSLLASTQFLKNNLPEHFIFFQPKDIVSGDFYWATELGNGQFAIATADSTGHGVPGAIMSMLNISCLNEAVSGQKLTAPNEILNYTRSRIIHHLANDGSEEGGKDGMDCSLISFDFSKKQLTYSSANNPVWIARGNEILAFSPDKMPVGKHDKDSVSFTQHTIQLQKEDVVYTFTDGMPDQFGGPNGKKFMYKQLKELLLSIAKLPMEEQGELLKSALNKWKSHLEQVDDICVIGVRIKG